MQKICRPRAFRGPIRLPPRLAGSLIIVLMLCARVAPLPAAEAQAPQPVDTRFEMEEIVVTGAVVQDPVREVPRNVTVITADDIAQAPSNNVVDLLAREAGVSLKSFFGHDKQSGIDLRGMGDTAGSNVVVMVDGVRLNPADSAGPDFSAIPLDQIERIEIVRGAGSVVYGDGAVGGVVNIITRKGGAGPERRLYATYGSDDAFDGRGSWRGTLDRLTYNLYAGYYDTEGYRDNGFYRKTDAGGRFGFDLSERLDLRAGAFWHQDAYGLPGPVSREDFESDERRTRTNFPDDAGETRDVRLTGGLDWQPAGRGVLSIDGAYRSRENRFVLGYTPLLSRAAQTDAIDEDTGSLALRYHTDYALWGLDHELLGGADYFTTDYRRDALSQNERKTGDVEDLGLFLMNRWSLSDRLRVRFGYRYDRYQGSFRTDQRRRVDGLRVWVPGVPVDRRWTNSALDVGAVYDFTPADTVFASYATSFRNPNVDELALAEEDLRPQNGHHVEIGLRHQAVGRWEAALTFFQTKITDEIYYGEDPGTRTIVNRNYEDKTLRRGLEIEAKWYPADALYLWANATWMKAEFENLGTRIPLVPERKASLGLEWQITDPLLLALTGTRVGSRVDGNDEANDRFRKLAAYQVVDGKLTYTFRGVKIFAGINNIFDERYATLAYSEAYYPMPTRNYYAGAEWRF